MKAIPVFYRPEMVADAGSFSPSAGKPRLAVENWQALGVPLDIRTFEPVTREQIKLAHDPAFVDDLLDCQISNGFGNRRHDVAASLPFTSGSMVAAAREALRNGIGAVSPTSGFHHAHYASAGGFCSLNGLMVAALNLPAATKIGILDLDQHDPDGVRDIVARLRLGIPIVHGRGTPASAERWLQKLPALIVETFIDCDLLLVQLGADPHIDDDLGSGWLTDDQLRRRDHAVFSIGRAIGLPLCWNLAGGYRREFRRVLDVHDATMQECARAWL
jgi:acetoin utilization deacetylase AcuC-like enzyme